MDVQVLDPHGVQVGDPEYPDQRKDVDLRALFACSESHMWSAAVLLDNILSVFENQID